MTTKPTEEPKSPRHVDDFIDDLESDDYAAFVLNFFRMPATYSVRFEKFTKHIKLFCTHEGKRYRVTYASCMGDICLSADMNRDRGYELRVDVDTCSLWSADP